MVTVAVLVNCAELRISSLANVDQQRTRVRLKSIFFRTRTRVHVLALGLGCKGLGLSELDYITGNCNISLYRSLKIIRKLTSSKQNCFVSSFYQENYIVWIEIIKRMTKTAVDAYNADMQFRQ